jgi:hypothetical protein
MAQQSCGTHTNTAGFTWLILGVPATAVYTLHNLAGGSPMSGRKTTTYVFRVEAPLPSTRRPISSATSDSIYLGTCSGRLLLS